MIIKNIAVKIKNELITDNYRSFTNDAVLLTVCTQSRFYKRFCTQVLKSHRGCTVVLLIPGAYGGCLNSNFMNLTKITLYGSVTPR